MAISIPQVSEAELREFHQSHFSESAVAHFRSQYFQPKETPAAQEAHEPSDEDIVEDDGLGYYPDGVKRTLTDEQIAIFRHSEIEALRRAQNKQATFISASSNKNSSLQSQKSAPSRENANDIVAHTNAASSRIKKSKHKNKQRRREPKPDLRKRTWDVVQPGLDSLEYD